jgi:hypothetical protein
LEKIFQAINTLNEKIALVQPQQPCIQAQLTNQAPREEAKGSSSAGSSMNDVSKYLKTKGGDMGDDEDVDSDVP